jgi:hypothetical protein
MSNAESSQSVEEMASDNFNGHSGLVFNEVVLNGKGDFFNRAHDMKFYGSQLSFTGAGGIKPKSDVDETTGGNDTRMQTPPPPAATATAATQGKGQSTSKSFLAKLLGY